MMGELIEASPRHETGVQKDCRSLRPWSVVPRPFTILDRTLGQAGLNRARDAERWASRSPKELGSDPLLGYQVLATEPQHSRHTAAIYPIAGYRGCPEIA